MLISLVSLAIITSYAFDNDRMRNVMQTRYGDDGQAILNAWLDLISASTNLTEIEQARQINDFFNKNIRFVDDIDNWKQSDYWATPLETLGTRAADCEDFTIAKYMSLMMLGIPAERLRLIYVKAQIGGPYSKHFQAHMVLGYYPTADALPLILDNLVSTIEPAKQRTDLRPVFSFNSTGLWIGSNKASQADPTARLSRWRDLLNRMQQEGLH